MFFHRCKSRFKLYSVILNNDINGWNAFSSKALSSNGDDFGIIIDFAGGGVYEMPQDDVKTYLSKFAPQDAFIIKELIPSKNNKGFAKTLQQSQLISQRAQSFI